MRRNITFMLCAAVTFVLAGVLAGCQTGPSNNEVETINSEIKSKQKSDLPPAPPPTDVLPAAPGSFGKGTH